MNGYVGGRTPVVKSHVLPAAGGAPFVTCNYCLQPLQLSQGFLPGKTQRYQVRCGGCFGLLNFSHQEKARSVSCTSNVSDSRTSSAADNVSTHQDDQEDSASVDHEETLSRLNNYCGDSVCKSSLSNDGELVDPLTFQGLAVNKDEQNISNESLDAMPETPQFQLKSLANEKEKVSENPESSETSWIQSMQTQYAHSEHSRNEAKNSNRRYELDNAIGDILGRDLVESGYERSEALDAGKEARDGSGVSMEDMGYKNETTNGTTKEAETTEDRLVSHRMEPSDENESSCAMLKLTENTGDMLMFDMVKSQEGGEYGGDRTWGETMGDRPGLHLQEYESNYENMQEQFSTEPERNAGAERVPTFRLDVSELEKIPTFRLDESELEKIPTFRQEESELEKLLEPIEAVEERSEIYLWGSFGDHKISSEELESDDNANERALSHEEKSREEDERESETIKPEDRMENVPSLHLERHENESRNFSGNVEPRSEASKLRLGEQLEQEEEMFAENLLHLDLSQDTHKNLKQALEPGTAEKDRSACSSRVCSNDHECSSKMIKLEVETAEHTLENHSEQKQDKDDKLGLTFEPYAHPCRAVDPSEIVGLRHALYATQSSPLRTPLTSPFHTPLGSPWYSPMASPLHSPMASPLHSQMASPLHSPMASPLRSHIVSPLRSPIKSSPSLSDVLFFGK